MHESRAVPPFNLVYEVMPDRFAGDGLRGLAGKAGYLAELGVDALYLTPIHPSPSNHRYDATDPRAVAEALGGMPAFETLVEAMHRRGIRIILDLVLNHVSSNHPWFLEAAADPASPRRGWFTFRPDGTYACWRGFSSLPELDLGSEAVLEALVTGEDSVVRFWVRRGADALRLDCANDLGVRVCRLATQAARSIRPEILVIGETFHYGIDWLQGLDGLQSYVPTFAILDFVQGRITGRQFGLTLEGLHRAAAPHGGLRHCWSMLSSHDIPRVRTALGEDAARLNLARLLQFTLPGTPLVYYGDENGMTGGADPLNRTPMVWEPARWDRASRDAHHRLIALRANHRELREGDFTDLSQWMDNGAAGFLRACPEDPRKFCVVFANPTERTLRFPVYVPAGRMFADMGMRDVLSGQVVTTGAGSMDLELAPMSGAMYVPEHRTERYDFAKRL